MGSFYVPKKPSDPFLYPRAFHTVCMVKMTIFLETWLDPGISVSDVLSTLRLQGWVALGPESRQMPTLSVARAFGDPIRGPTGELVRKLVPKNASEAVAGTFSREYGKGEFPLHTDTAFWPLPARYLVFRVTGDTRRPTVVARFPLPLPPTMAREVVSSVWVVKGLRPFYCSMQFRANGEMGLRYDQLTMKPVNNAAKSVLNGMPSVLAQLRTFSIDWAAVGTVIIDNWRVLHGRGHGPDGEGERVLERVYLR
jgi:hypothetical protein